MEEIGSFSVAFLAGSWMEGDQLGVWHVKNEKMATLTWMVAVKVARSGYVWCFEGTGTNLGGTLNMRLEKK